MSERINLHWEWTSWIFREYAVLQMNGVSPQVLKQSLLVTCELLTGDYSYYKYRIFQLVPFLNNLNQLPRKAINSEATTHIIIHITWPCVASCTIFKIWRRSWPAATRSQVKSVYEYIQESLLVGKESSADASTCKSLQELLKKSVACCKCLISNCLPMFLHSTCHFTSWWSWCLLASSGTRIGRSSAVTKLFEPNASIMSTGSNFHVRLRQFSEMFFAHDSHDDLSLGKLLGGRNTEIAIDTDTSWECGSGKSQGYNLPISRPGPREKS